MLEGIDSIRLPRIESILFRYPSMPRRRSGPALHRADAVRAAARCALILARAGLVGRAGGRVGADPLGARHAAALAGGAEAGAAAEAVGAVPAGALIVGGAGNAGFIAGQPPVAVAGTANTYMNLPVSIDLDAFATDPQGLALGFSITAVQNGSVLLSSDGHTVIFTPDANYTGPAPRPFVPISDR